MRIQTINELRAARDILEGCGVLVRKALNPLIDRDFIIITGRLAKALRVAGVDEVTALNSALKMLDVNWPEMTEKQIDRVIEASRKAIIRSVPDATQGVVSVLETDGAEISQRSRTGTRKEYALDIPVNFSNTDRKIVEHTARSQGNFVSTAIGDRSEAYSKQARKIVSSGLSEGMGRKDIAAQLNRKLPVSYLGRRESYYEVVAGSFTNRARTFGQLSSLRDAEIKRYVLEAMLDEVTTDICRFMHGKSFEVDSGISTIERVDALEDPNEIKDEQPWVQTRKTPDGGEELQLVSRGEVRTVARITESAVGRSDETGKFSGGMSEAELSAAGVLLPPFHGLCRTTVVPDF